MAREPPTVVDSSRVSAEASSPAGFDEPARAVQSLWHALIRLGISNAGYSHSEVAPLIRIGRDTGQHWGTRGWSPRAAFPITTWVATYRRAWLRRDVGAGITLAAYAVPGSLAYATLAGLPAQAGLYCYIVGGLAYAMFGTSRQATIGPTSAISILVGASVGALSAGDAKRYAALAAATAVLVAGVALVAWILRLGQIVHFISETVLGGFKVGVALVIASTQLPKLLGIAPGGSEVFSRIAHVVRHVGEAHIPTLVVGLGALAFLIAGKRLLPKRPTALIVVVLSMMATSLTSLAASGVAVLGPVPQGLPAVGLPGVSLADGADLFPLALACFLLSYIESVSVARTFAAKHRYDVDVDQELLALGAANVAAGIAQGYPVAGGMSQSAVNDKAGARTPLAIVVTSIVVALVLTFFAGVFCNLPSAVLAAVVLMAVKGLIDVAGLKHLFRVSRPDFLMAIVAMAGVLALGILQGVLLATIVSLLLLVRRAAHPHTAVIGRIPGTHQFGDLARHPGAETVPGVLLYRVYGGIVYFNVDHVRHELLRLVENCNLPVWLVVFDLSSSPTVDLAGVRMLRALHEQLAARDIRMDLAEARGALRDLLEAEGAVRLFREPGRSVAAMCDAALQARSMS
jgi:sulfate permease, SulP family